MSRIAIIGGHGKVALQLTKILTKGGHQVSSVIRNPDPAAAVEAAGATPVVADIAELSVEQMADVLREHAGVVWAAGAGGSSVDATYAIDRDAAIRSMDAAEQASARRYVMVSYIGSKKDHGVPEDDGFVHYAEAKAAADEHLRASSLGWTILGPGALTDGPATGNIEVGDEPQQDSVTREDVAKVAAMVLADPGSKGKTIRFNNGSMSIVQAVQGAR